MRRAIATGAVFALLGAAPAGAQSRYSLHGFGEAALPSRAATRALGAAEAADAAPSLTGNPASLSEADRTLFYGTYVTEWVETKEVTDAGTLVRQDYTGMLSNVCLIFPIGPAAFGTGFLVDRRQGGKIQQPAVTDTTAEGAGYLQTFDASGNLLRIPALLAVRVRKIEIGAGLDVLLENRKQRWINDFSGNDDFTSSNDVASASTWGVAWRGGIRIPVGLRLHLGGWVHIPNSLSGTLKVENDDPSGGSRERDIDSEVAPSWAAGVQFRPYYRLRILVDWVHQQWQDVSAPEGTVFVNVDRFGGGIEWTSTGGAIRWPLRLGYRTENLHTLDAGGREVREHFVTVGSGFGVGGGRGEIDWFLEYGRRGESGVSEFAEQVYRIGVTLTGAERWTRRRPPEEGEDW